MSPRLSLWPFCRLGPFGTHTGIDADSQRGSYMMYEPVLQLNVTCSKLACPLQRRVSISLSEISYTVYIRSLDSLELQYHTFSCKLTKAGYPKRCRSQSHVVRIRHLLFRWTQPERFPSFRHCCIRPEIERCATFLILRRSLSNKYFNLRTFPRRNSDHTVQLGCEGFGR